LKTEASSEEAKLKAQEGDLLVETLNLGGLGELGLHDGGKLL